MKKIILFINLLGIAIFSNDFNFKIANPISFNLETYVDFSNEYNLNSTKESMKETDFSNVYKLDTTIYEFVTIDGSVSYKLKTKKEDKVKLDKSNTNVGILFDLKKYGKISSKYYAEKEIIENKKNMVLDFKYSNKIDIKYLNLITNLNYEYGFENKINNLDINLGLSKDVLKELNIESLVGLKFHHFKAEEKINLAYNPYFELNFDYVPVKNLKILSANNFSIENTKIIMENKINEKNMNFKIKNINEISYEINEDLLKTDIIKITPSIKTEFSSILSKDKSDVFLSLIPKFNTEIKLVKGLYFDTNLYTAINFETKNKKENINFKNVKPYFNMGLRYEWSLK